MKFEINTDTETLYQVYIALKEYEYAHSGIGLTSGFVSIIDSLEDALADDLSIKTEEQSSIAQDDETPLDIFNI